MVLAKRPNVYADRCFGRFSVFVQHFERYLNFMTTVYIIRHAEAEGNLYRRIQGWYDSRVTDLGLRQVEALEKRFENTHFDAVYSSDKTRTRVTAGAIYKSRNLPLTETPDLREVNMGEWEDAPWGNIERYDRSQLSYFNNDPEKWSVPGSEHFFDTQKRMLKTLRSLAKKHDGETIALVSHGAAIRCLLCAILGVPSERINDVRHCDNTAVALLYVDGDDIKVEYMGDSSHLGELTHFNRQAWWKNNTGFDSTNLRHEKLTREEHGDLYISARRELFEAAGNIDEFDGEELLSLALSRAEKEPHALDIAYMDDEPAGIIELDVEKDAEKGIGWIEFHSMLPNYRGKLLAIQMLGHAVSAFRHLGRTKLRIAVPANLESVIGYHLHFGFLKCETVDSSVILEKDISL